MTRTRTNKLVLIVDDNITNLKVAIQYLKSHDLEIITARNGESCLERAAYAQPDLILLDVQMPGIDGFETCQRLKSDEATQDIPVIFMTALSEISDKVRGFEVGGVDYITKPIQVEEVWARVNTHLTIRQLQQEMGERITELDAFAHTVAHDLKNPLSRIITGLDLLQVRERGKLNPDSQNILNISLSGGFQMVQIIDELLLLASVRQEDIDTEPVSMQAIVTNARQRVAHMIEEKHAEVLMPDEWETAVGYAPWLEEVWANYMSNSLKYGGHPPRVQLGSERLENGMVRYWIQDNGEGLTEDDQNKLFQAFSRLDRDAAKGHGLGLSIVERIINRLGGTVGVESTLGQGSTFYFTLPSVPDEA